LLNVLVAIALDSTWPPFAVVIFSLELGATSLILDVAVVASESLYELSVQPESIQMLRLSCWMLNDRTVGLRVRLGL
jgi:hypothetical protein